MKERALARPPWLRRQVVAVLAAIGAATCAYGAGALALHAWRSRAPDMHTELVSPDHRYQIIVEEELAGFPGAVCVKKIYVAEAERPVDRDDEDEQVYAGACDGVTALQWRGGRVEASVSLPNAVHGVRLGMFKAAALRGRVPVAWIPQ